nr:3'-5' exonuclease [Rhabdobacter roseus]
MDLILHLSQDKALALGPLLDVGTSAHSSFTQERLLGIDRFLTTDHLRTNRRSFREITEFNNQFFAFVARQLTNEHPMVGAIFDEHFQQEIPPQVPTGGHVQLEFLEMNTDENEAPEGTLAVDAITRRALELIEELRASGYHWRDIAILCRKKNEARTLANALREKGYPLISEDSLSLAYARSVSLLVAFMKVLHTSDNRLARYEAAYLFHQVVLEQVPTAAQHEAIRSMCAEKGLGTFVRYFGELGVELNAFRLRQLSVYELCEQLITSFRLFEHQTENAYLFRFLDVVLDFGTRRSNHLGDFLTYWESAKDKLSITIPANADALRITTIHRSKGLEYPVVIVPYAHWSFTPNPQLDRLWVDLEAIKNQELALAETTEEGEVLTRRMLSSVVSVVSDLDKTGLKTQYQDEKTRTLVENLNLLYVAFTRPIQRMYLLARQEKDWNKYGAPSKVSRWLYDYLGHPDAEPGWQEGQSCYVLSPGSGPLRHAHRDGEAIPHRLSTLISTDRTKSLRLRRLAERIFDVDTFEKKKDHLQKVRHALSLLPSAAELPTTLRKLTTEGIVEKHEARTVQHTLEKVLALDKLRPFFDPQNQVVLQRELLLPGGKMLRADRTATLPDGSVLLALFVAGSGNDDARRQLRRLVQAYRDMGAATVRGYLVLLETGQLEWVE